MLLGYVTFAYHVYTCAPPYAERLFSPPGGRECYTFQSLEDIVRHAVKLHDKVNT